MGRKQTALAPLHRTGAHAIIARMAAGKLAVVIPGWNEAGNIPCFYLQLFPSLSAEMAVSVRNDNSTGGTVEFAERTAVAHESRQPGV